jgi:similar to stage IV sporulation protein
VEVRLTSAEPERALRRLAEKFTLSGIVWEDDLTVRFAVLRKEWTLISALAENGTDRYEFVSIRGLPFLLRKCFAYPVICAVIGLTLFATWYIPGRIFFIQVEGNRHISTEQILECAETCGLCFGSAREALRSEQIKNQLLERMPELSWVGVNTVGCRAVITVQERQVEQMGESPLPGNIVAGCDAVITSVTATAGNTLVDIGAAVKRGDVLITGYTDLGFCTHVEAAEGEVYGITQHEIDAVMPEETLNRGEQNGSEEKYSLIIGKKRINFYSDSGILHTGCGKMTKIRYLCLPGGWSLPIALVIETYSFYDDTVSVRWEATAQDTLCEVSRKFLMDSMTAGQIRSSQDEFVHENGVYRQLTQYECHEMIGRFSSVIFTEGDTQNDGENGERGAG